MTVKTLPPYCWSIVAQRGSREGAGDGAARGEARTRGKERRGKRVRSAENMMPDLDKTVRTVGLSCWGAVSLQSLYTSIGQRA